jgi:hypothetical protein
MSQSTRFRFAQELGELPALSGSIQCDDVLNFSRAISDALNEMRPMFTIAAS